MYTKIINGVVDQYPYTLQELYEDNPGVYFPADLTNEILVAHNAARVVVTGQPEHDAMTQGAVEITPIYSAERSRWEQAWQIVPLSAVQIAANAIELQSQIVAATQERLDAFARTRSYDGILSACTYATSTVSTFQAEAQYCVSARDATWAKLYQILAEGEAGVRPVPSCYKNIEPELPQLVWPT